MDILLSPKGLLYLDLLIANVIKAWSNNKELLTEEDLDAAIEVEEARKEQLDARREAH